MDLIRSAAEAKNRDADRLECEAWNAIMWDVGQMPSPGVPQAEPMIGKAINGGFDLLEAQPMRPGFHIAAASVKAAGAASLEAGSLAVPRVLQRRPALQPAGSIFWDLATPGRIPPNPRTGSHSTPMISCSGSVPEN